MAQGNRFDDMVGDSADENTTNEDNAVSTDALSDYSNEMQLDQDDIMIPRLKIAQGQTAEVQSGDARPGNFVVPGEGVFDEVTVIPLKFAKRRELRTEERDVLCSSTDAVHGVGEPGGLCKTCPEARWTDEGTRRVPPTCDFEYSYLVYIVEAEIAAVLSIRRTSLPAGRKMNTSLMRHGLGKAAFRLTTNQRKSGRYTWYVLNVEPSEMTKELAEKTQSDLLLGV